MGKFFTFPAIGGLFGMIGYTAAYEIEPTIVLGVLIVSALVYIIYLIFSEEENKFGKIIGTFAAVVSALFAVSALE